VEGLCERGDEPPGSIKCWEVLEQLHNWQLLKKGSAPWVSVMSDALIIFPLKSEINLGLNTRI
jgi:hypothetical protein